jgi:hypothetical protein
MHSALFAGRLYRTLLNPAVNVTGVIALEPVGGPYEGWFVQPEGQQFTTGQGCDLVIDSDPPVQRAIRITGIQPGEQPLVEFLTL